MEHGSNPANPLLQINLFPLKRTNNGSRINSSITNTQTMSFIQRNTALLFSLCDSTHPDPNNNLYKLYLKKLKTQLNKNL